MSPTSEDAALTLLAALRQDLQNFRDEWKRELQELVTKAVFDSEMKRRDEQVEALKSALEREGKAREAHEKALENERQERRTTTRWVLTFLGTPVVALAVNAVVEFLSKR